MPTRTYRRGQSSSRLTPGQWVAYIAIGVFVLLLIIGAIVGSREADEKHRAQAQRAAQVQREWEERSRLSEQDQQWWLEWKRQWDYNAWCLTHPEQARQARENAERARLQALRRAEASLNARRIGKGMQWQIELELGPRNRPYDYEDKYRTGQEDLNEDNRYQEEWKSRWEALRAKYGLTKLEMEVLVGPNDTNWWPPFGYESYSPNRIAGP